MTPVAAPWREVTAPATPWRVMIVEDNPAVAALHKRIVDGVPYLRTEHLARNGQDAYAAMRSVQPDLVILDLTMTGGDGLPFLRRVRGEGIPVDVIVVTASRGGRVVQEVTHLGVVDYLVKPFDPARLREALAAFALRHRTLTRARELTQDDVDRVRGSASKQAPRLPKGLRRATLAQVVAALQSSAEPRTADGIGAAVGLARVTARRYLEHLELVGVVEKTPTINGPGRPRNLYRLKAGSS